MASPLVQSLCLLTVWAALQVSALLLAKQCPERCITSCSLVVPQALEYKDFTKFDRKRWPDVSGGSRHATLSQPGRRLARTLASLPGALPLSLLCQSPDAHAGWTIRLDHDVCCI